MDSGGEGFKTGGIQERRDSGLQGYRKGRITRGIQDWRDSGLEGFKTGGIQERRDSGLEGYRKGGIQDSRDTGMRDSGLERF